jgi:hypothetical protein
MADKYDSMSEGQGENRRCRSTLRQKSDELRILSGEGSKQAIYEHDQSTTCHVANLREKMCIYVPCAKRLTGRFSIMGVLS